MPRRDSTISAEHRPLILPLLLAVGLFLPWAKAEVLVSVTMTGFDMTVWPLVGLSILALVGAWLYEDGQYRGVGWIVSGGVLLASLVWTYSNLNAIVQEFNSAVGVSSLVEAGGISYGLGFYLTVLVAIAVLVIGIRAYDRDLEDVEFVRQRADDLPVAPKYALVALVLLMVVATAGTGATTTATLGGEPNPTGELKVAGHGEERMDTIFAETEIRNPTEHDVTANVTARLKVDGEVMEGFSATKEVNIRDKDKGYYSFALGKDHKLPQEEFFKYQDGKYSIEILVDGEVLTTL